MASGSISTRKDGIELHTAVNAGHDCVLRAKRKRSPSERKPPSAKELDTGVLCTSFKRDCNHLSLSRASQLDLPPLCCGLDQSRDGCDPGRLLPPAQHSRNASGDCRNSCDVAGNTENPEGAQAQAHPGALCSADAVLTSATKIQLALCTVISVEAEADCLALSDSPASSPESTSGSSGRDSVSPERSPSPPPPPPTTISITISSITPSRKRAHDGESEESSTKKKRRTEGGVSLDSHILAGHVQLSSRESTDPGQPSLLDLKLGCGLSSRQLRSPTTQSQHEATMELVFVHESGDPDFDGVSDTSEENNQDEDEEGWGRVEFSSSGTEKYSTLRGCTFPVEGGRPSSEKLLNLSHAPEGPVDGTDFPTAASQFVWDAFSGAVVEPADLVQLARRNPPYVQLRPVGHPPNSRIPLTDYRSNTPLISLGEFKELLDNLSVSVDDGHINVPSPCHMSGPRFPPSFPSWQCALEDEAFVFADKEEAIQASSLWIEAVQNVREDMQAYLEMTGEMLVFPGFDLNADPLITARSRKPSIRHPRLISRLVNGLYSWTPWRIPLNATFDDAIDPDIREHASLDGHSLAMSTFAAELEPIERSIPELFLVTPDSDHDMGFNRGSISVAETMKDSQALHPWRSRYSLSTT